MTKSLCPENYNIPSVFGYFNHDVRKKRSPAYTIGQRLHSADPASDKPGPTTYEISPCATRFGKPGKSGTEFSKLGRFQGGTQSNALAPNSYDVNKVVKGIDLSKRNTPKYSIGKHSTLKESHLAPPPNRYNLQAYKPGSVAPAFSFGQAARKLHDTQSKKRRPKKVKSS